ncbi:hypothetical protein [Speluncibacter jeojiensis]|uniref:Ferric siderophore reductase C-terminal domain-containing protein n=1 Tax=Speluncibacter jeojiensis TaxID=2710754 RepID=A0A9X4RIZ8_9ACTN|nr:hypothetical protein [Corynebacteriales bacterium D3-21]
MTVEPLYAHTAGRVPGLAASFTPTGRRSAGSVLTDRQWLAARVADTSRRWAGAEGRVSGTLWWYSASSTLLGASLGVRLACGVWLDPDPARTAVYVDDHGMLLAARPERTLPGRTPGESDHDVARAGGAWHGALASIIESLARVSGAREPALWAVASDSLANRGLEAGRALGDQRRGRDVALALAEGIGVPLPAPRFVDVGGADRSRLVCRRNSCCLIDQTGLADRCASCPRRHPDERARILGRPR